MIHIAGLHLRIENNCPNHGVHFTIGRRIAERINWLAKNLDNLEPEMLRGELSGLYKLRAGAYRILYEILSEDSVIVIHKIGHRRDVYRVR